MNLDHIQGQLKVDPAPRLHDPTRTLLNVFFDDMAKERMYQLDNWDESFDAKNTSNDWIAYINKYLGKAVTYPWDPATFRTMMVKVATLCAGAAEWHDRTNGEMAKRHYDK